MSFGPDTPIYVAGHTGLVGSGIRRCLESRGCRRLILKTRSELDLADGGAVSRFFAEERPEVVFLAAARVGGIQANQSRPVEFLLENLRIETSVISAAFRHGVRRLLFLASTCVYPKHAPQPMEPAHLLTGPIEPTNEPYAIAKIAGVKLCQAYRQQFGSGFTSVIAANAYGPGDRFDDAGHVVSSLLRRMHDAKVSRSNEVVAWGTGSPLREFLYVDDLAEACLFLAERPDVPDIVNVGSGEELPIRDLAEAIRRAVAFPGEVRFDPARPDGSPRRLLDSRWIRSEGWRPRVALAEGLAQTYEAFLRGIRP